MYTLNKASLPMYLISFMTFDEVIFDEVIDPQSLVSNRDLPALKKPRWPKHG
jgi:hypothetical protein